MEAAAGGVGRVTRANTHPALRPSPATPTSRAASAPPRPVTRGRPDRHSLFPGAGRRPAGPTCPARRGAAEGLGVRGAAPAPEPPPSAPRPPPPAWPGRAGLGPASPPRSLRPRPLPAPSAPSPQSPARSGPAAAPPPQPGGKEGRRCPLRASQGCSPLRRFQNTQPGARASRGGGPGRPGHQSAGSGGKGGPGRGGKGWAPRPARPLLGRVRATLLKKKQKKAPVVKEREDRGGFGAEERRERGGQWG